MNKFLIFIFVLVLFGQFSYQTNGLHLRKFGISFKARKYEQSAKTQNAMKEMDMELEAKKKHEEEEEARRKIVQKYLLPLAGRTSFLNDFYNRV
jgi:hypothetical protein